jgi:hypothetical protein
MNFCTKCGRPRAGAAQFCTGCGAQLGTLPPVAAPATTEQARPTGVPAQWPASVPPQHGPAARQPGEAAPSDSASPDTAPLRIPAVQGGFGVGESAAGVPLRNSGSVPGRRGTGKAGFVLAGVLAVLLAGGAVVWAVTRHSGQAGRPAAGHVTRLAQGTPTRPEPTATPSPGFSSGLVMVAPGVPRGGAEPAVVTFLDEYFSAINNHDFQQYESLLDASLQQNETLAKFNAGYGTTADSGATLVNLAPGSGSAVAATITFTSHQSAADSPTRTTCTSWQTTLYLHPQGLSYEMGVAPSSYPATYRPC